MKDIFGLLVLGTLAIASLSLWPQADADKKIISQGMSERVGKKIDLVKMFSHDTSPIVVSKKFN